MWRPVLTHTIPGGQQPVSGVTALNKEVFLIRDDTPKVEVYDSNTWTLTRYIKINGLIKPCDLTSCAEFCCLYIADQDSLYSIHRVKLNEEMTKWSTIDCPESLSVTPMPECNVLVTFRIARKLCEFTTHGVLVREIGLYEDITEPLHAILSNGHFIVCHGYLSTEPLHRICIVDFNGRLTRSYGRAPGSAVGKLNWPSHLAVDKDGNFLVADGRNSRVLLLSPDLTENRELLTESAVSGSLWPCRLCNTEEHLFVANSCTKAVIVFS